MRRILSFSLVATALLLTITGRPVQAGTMVDTKLSLVIDISASVSTGEYNLQMDAYANAFRNPVLQDVILNTGPLGKIAVNTVFFATSATTSNPFTILDSSASIDSYADVLDSLSRPGGIGSSTAIGRGMSQSITDLLDTTVAESSRLVMDVSGDGTSNTGPSPASARDSAIANSIRVNGISIGGGTFLRDYYADNVVTPDGFLFAVDGFPEFEAGILRKLRVDIGGAVPEPSSFLAWSAFAMFGFGTGRRRRRTA